MSYTYSFDEVGKVYSSGWARSPMYSMEITLSYISTVQRFCVKATGTINIKFVSYRDVYGIAPTQWFMGKNLKFNYATGEMNNYTYTGSITNLSGSTTISVTEGEVWYFVIRGYQENPVRNYTMGINEIKYLDYIYVEKPLSSITNFHGNSEYTDFFVKNHVKKIPITFAYPGLVGVFIESYNRYTVYITTADTGINTATGVPNSPDISGVPEYGGGRVATITAGTQYYLWFKYNTDEDYERCLKYVICTADEDYFTYSGETYTITDQYGRSCGVGKFWTSENALFNDYYNDYFRLYCDTYVYWYPSNIDLSDPYDPNHTYTRAVFEGWYSDAAMTYLNKLSSDPSFIYVRTSPDHLNLYARVLLVDDDFSWNVSLSGEMITALSWNAFVTYAMQKKLKTTSRIDEPFHNHWVSTHNLRNHTLTAFANSGDIFYAYLFNYIKNMLDINMTDKLSLDIIYASDMNLLLSTARSL